MNKHEIEKVLTEQITCFPNHKRDLIISGGCITSMLLNEPVNDYDMWFMNVDRCNIFLQDIKAQLGFTKMQIDSFPSQPPLINWKSPPPQSKQIIAMPGYVKVTFDQNTSNPLEVEEHINGYGSVLTKKKVSGKTYKLTTNALTINDGINPSTQMIFKHCGSPMDIHKTFDFIHCVNYFTLETGLVLNKYALECIISKELKYLSTENPIHSIMRVKKFLQRGWNINTGELLKFLYDITKVDLHDRDQYKDIMSSMNLQNILGNKDLTRENLFESIDKAFN